MLRFEWIVHKWISLAKLKNKNWFLKNWQIINCEHCNNVTKSLASWKMNVKLARIQSVIIKQTFEELSRIRSGSIYDSGRIVVGCSWRRSFWCCQSVKHFEFFLCLYWIVAVRLDGTGIGTASELRNCQRIKMTTKTLYGRFPTRRVGKVTFVFDLYFLCHSFHYVCQAVPLHGQLLLPDVIFRAVDR